MKEKGSEESTNRNWLPLVSIALLLLLCGGGAYFLLNRAGETGGESVALEPPAAQELPPDVAVRLERIQAVRDAIEELDPRCRRLLTLLYLDRDGCSYKDAARALGMPTGSVGPIRIRCLSQVAEILDRGGIE